jgi:hypothetical protein
MGRCIRGENVPLMILTGSAVITAALALHTTPIFITGVITIDVSLFLLMHRILVIPSLIIAAVDIRLVARRRLLITSNVDARAWA